jgi:hypothetical protein
MYVCVCVCVCLFACVCVCLFFSVLFHSVLFNYVLFLIILVLYSSFCSAALFISRLHPHIRLYLQFIARTRAHAMHSLLCGILLFASHGEWHSDDCRCSLSFVFGRAVRARVGLVAMHQLCRELVRLCRRGDDVCDVSKVFLVIGGVGIMHMRSRYVL